jgi:hypothetical protein
MIDKNGNLILVPENAHVDMKIVRTISLKPLTYSTICQVLEVGGQTLYMVHEDGEVVMYGKEALLRRYEVYDPDTPKEDEEDYR